MIAFSNQNLASSKVFSEVSSSNFIKGAHKSNPHKYIIPTWKKEEEDLIFEDFDSQKDKVTLQKYVKKFSTDKGIMLSRHRLVMVVQKVAEPVKAR